MKRHKPATCHPDRRTQARGLCIQCDYAANKEKYRAARKRYYDRNKEAAVRRASEWKRKNPEKVKAQRLAYWDRRGGAEVRARYHRNDHYRRAYGLTYEAVEVRINLQRNRCRICADTLGPIKSGVGPQVDHDHKTGQIRGIICHHCNKMMGHAKDRPQILANAAHYLMAC